MEVPVDTHPSRGALRLSLAGLALAAAAVLLPAGVLEAATQLRITTTSLPRGLEGTSYSTTLTATGGVGAYSWRLRSGSTLPTS